MRLPCRSVTTRWWQRLRASPTPIAVDLAGSLIPLPDEQEEDANHHIPAISSAEAMEIRPMAAHHSGGGPPGLYDQAAAEVNLDAAALVRTRRHHAGLTQAELARRAGIGLGTVRDLEQGRTCRPSYESVSRVANVLVLDAEKMRELARKASAVPHDGGRQGVRLWLQILGPLAVWLRGKPLEPRSRKRRILLGLLAMTPNTLVHQEALIDAVWGDYPPATAVSLVRSYVSRMRRVLDPGRASRDPAGVMVSAGTSYCLRVNDGQLDLLTFERMARCGRTACARGDVVEACEHYQQALGMWHGELLAGIEVPRSHPAYIDIGRRHAAVICDYADAACAAGLPTRALPFLWDLAARAPLDERVYAQLMIALAGAGQQATALIEYEGLRRRLDAELGVRPGPELAAAHLRVLRQEVPSASMQRLVVHNGAHAAVPVVPRELPATAGHFAGRQSELAALTSMLDDSAGTARTAVIWTICGTAGVGKTALALHWAHQVADRWPDGQLYVNLRGYDPGQPVSAADALAGFLRALGLQGQDIPPGEDECAARYRSLLARRRMLVILDNAACAEQVRPLLPGAPYCMALITSRDSLVGLVAREGARRLDLNVLAPADAVGLLRALIGDRVDNDLAAAAALATQCCWLPLALRVAGELAAAHPALSLADLVGELTEPRRRLDLLDADGDPRTGIRAMFSWSVRCLESPAWRAFRLLGKSPGANFDHYSTAALCGTTVREADRLLDQLTRAHLMYRTGPGRCGMHDLLRAYVAEQADIRDSAGERERR
jgi:DNA-binding SARP family transcriptional activator/DNA-binding XRE family transcriptional regulator